VSASEELAAALPAAEPRAGSTASFPPPASAPAASPDRATPGALADKDDTAASLLKREAGLLRQARAQLRGGQLAAASQTLDQSYREFPTTALYQEREALSIELLHRGGQQARARDRARAFLARFPSSPHAAQLKLLVAP
jgi:predicted Zn-dependent protease